MPIRTSHALLHRFRQLLKASEAADIAVAWATHGPAIEELRHFCTRGGNLRIIVGTDRNVTNPATLRDIHLWDQAQLRVASPPAHGIFHPKYYCFHKSSRSAVWIGSANLTSSGFGGNDELILEAKGSRDSIAWFKELWSKLPKDPTKEIEDYEQNYSPPAYPPRRAAAGRLPRTKASTETDRLAEDWSWDDFVGSLRAKDEAMRAAADNGVEASVFGDYRSWLYTIRAGRPLTKLTSWRNLKPSQTDVLLGRDWGALGTLRGAGRACSIMTGSRKKDGDIRNDILRHVRAASKDGADVIPMGVKALKGISVHDRIGVGTATRFLALARPDRYVALNGASRKGLAAGSGLSASTLDKHYGELLEWVHGSKWYAVKRPFDDPLQAEIWDCRAALVDALVYDPA